MIEGRLEVTHFSSEEKTEIRIMLSSASKQELEAIISNMEYALSMVKMELSGRK